MLFFINKRYSLSITEHLINGSPSKPRRQLQIGAWLTTLHSALCPQAPMQGSTHFCRMQLLLESHSELTVHSGRQLGGEPKKLGMHEHEAKPLLSLQKALLPQGLGMQGLAGAGAEINKNVFKKKYTYIWMIIIS